MWAVMNQEFGFGYIKFELSGEHLIAYFKFSCSAHSFLVLQDD